MIRSKLGIIAGLVIVGLGAAVVFEYQANQTLIQKNTELTGKLDQLASLTRENARLSNLVAHAGSQAKLTQEQTDELFRLRREVSSARTARTRQSSPPSQPSRRDHQPATAPTPSVSGTSLLSTNTATTQLASISKGQWAFAGYDTPEAALQSVMWAMSQGDLQTLQAGLSTEAQRTLSTELDGKTEDEITSTLVQKTSGISELSFNRRTVHTDGRVTFNITSDVAVTFTKVDGAWKMSN
jgi:hypothetical protein